MKRGISAAVARCVVAATLVIGLMPTIALAEGGDASSTPGESSTEASAPETPTGPETPPADENTNIAEGTWGTAAWVIDKVGALTVGAGTGASANGTSPWAEYADEITSVTFEGTTAPSSCQGLLAGLSKAVSIDLSKLDTSATTNMSSMLANCSALATLNLSGVDSSRVTNMAGMFSGCSALASLDLSDFSTARATSMTGMFDDCNALSQVTVGREFSFKGSGSAVLTELPSTAINGYIDWYSTNEETWFGAHEIASDHNNIFTQYRKSKASPLVDPNAPTDPDDPSQEPANGAWGSSTWSIDESGTLTIAGSLPNITSKTEVPWADYASQVKCVSFTDTATAQKSIDGLFKDLVNATSINLTGLDTSQTTSMASLFSGCRSLQSVDLMPLKTSKVTNMNRMFAGCAELTSVDLSKIDGSSVTNLGDMFRRCSSLKDVNFNGFDTSHVTYMAGMFYGCAMLKTFDLASINMSANTTLSEMFAFCTSLENVSFNGADTSRVTRMDSMFNGCSSLAGIDFASADTSSVTRMDYLLNGCSSLATVNASKLDTSAVTTMENMFAYCSSLLTLDLSSLNTSKVTNMANMFYRCGSLHSLTLKFNTQRVTTMASMFYTCQYLTDLDLSSFATASVTDMHDMFAHCTYLQHLNIAGFSTRRASNMANMFSGCTYLSQVSVGSGFSFAGTSDEPQCTLPASYWPWNTTDWYSTADRAWHSSETISRMPSGKATVFQKGTTAPDVITYPVTGENFAFTDVNYMDWYGPSASYVSGRGIIKGYDGTTLFGVGDTMTRAQFAVILCRLFGGGDDITDGSYPANTTGLADVADNAWYTGAANWAVENGVITGIENADGTKSFGPDKPLEFQQMIVIISRCAEATAPESTEVLDKFVDGQDVQPYARGSMAWAVEEGIVSGYSGVELRPAEAVSRERAATIITSCCLLGYLA